MTIGFWGPNFSLSTITSEYSKRPKCEENFSKCSNETCLRNKKVTNDTSMNNGLKNISGVKLFEIFFYCTYVSILLNVRCKDVYHILIITNLIFLL